MAVFESTPGSDIAQHLGEEDIVEFAEHTRTIDECVKSADPEKIFSADFAKAFKRMREIAVQNGCDVQCVVLLRGSLQHVNFALMVPTKQRGH